MAHTNSSNAARGDQPVYRQILDNLTKELSLAEAIVVSSLPRGGLQIVQPQRLNELFLRTYEQQFAIQDQLTWQAIARNAPVRAAANSNYVNEFMIPLGYSYAAAAPLAEPVFEGYGGAIQVLRKEEQGNFTDAELRKLADAARRLDNLIASARASRAGDKDGEADFVHRPAVRQFVFGSNGKIQLFASSFDELDDSIQRQVHAEVRRGLDELGDDGVISERLALPDSNGDNWIANVVTYANYPALGEGAAVFVCLQPTAPEWELIRVSDFQADPEMSRLVPALRFMQQEFHRGPTLVEIAKTVHLSPFHFHRRFTELFGITPKHLLLECQIHEAKGELLSGKKELSRIASDCGFAHQSHFTSRFKQAAGLTPTRWRRMAITRNGNNGD
jgi:AraC-like DNA-binding protein